MFGELGSFQSLENLDDEDRTRLANLLSKRNDYLAELMKLNELRVSALLSPTAGNQEAVAAFSTTVVAPLRDGMTVDVLALLGKAVDVESIKAIAPLIVAGVLRSVNIPLLLAVLGMEPDMVDKLVAAISEYVRSGM